MLCYVCCVMCVMLRYVVLRYVGLCLLGYVRYVMLCVLCCVTLFVGCREALLSGVEPISYRAPS